VITEAFPPKVISASRKPYRCFTCLGTIGQGVTYVRHPVKEGKTVKTLRLCWLCTMILKDSKDNIIKPGGYTDRLIPNVLRKKKAEFLRKWKNNSTQAILEQIAK
jgi:hypothetical protein